MPIAETTQARQSHIYLAGVSPVMSSGGERLQRGR
jgi:hypothetical protein